MIYLVEVEAHNGTGVVTLYFGTDGYTTKPTDTPANIYYDPRIEVPGNFERFLFGDGTTMGASRVGFGEVKILAADPGNGLVMDPIINYGFDGRRITIKALSSIDAAISTATILFRGTMEQLVSDNPVDELSFAIHDRLSDLDKPLLTARYAGTTITEGPTAEGNTDLKNQIKPRVFGRVFNVPCVLANQFDLIYQVSASAVQSITVFDAGHQLTNAGDYGTIAALKAATQVPGQYMTCLAQGLFRLGWPAYRAPTAHVVEGASAGTRTAAQIVRRMLLEFGISAGDLPTASFAALDALNSAELGLYLDSDVSALSAVSAILDTVGGWISPNRLGVFEVGRLGPAVGTPVATYGEGEQLGGLQKLEILDSGKGLPAWRTTIKWGRVYTVQSDSDLVDTTAAAQRSLVAQEWREAKVENDSVKTIHPQANEIVIESCFAYEADALAEATRRQTFYGAQRERYKFDADVSVGEVAQIGSTVRLQQDRLGLSSGKNGTVIGRVDDYQDDKITLDVII